MIRTIFWDNDGVLVDTERLYFQTTKEVFAGIGIGLTREQYIEHVLVGGNGTWHMATEKGFSAAEVERLREERNDRYVDLLTREKLVIDGVREVLDSLYGRYSMGIVTSSQRHPLEIIHRATGLMDYFDFVITANDCTRLKPDPEPYLTAVERSGTAKDECIIVEDSQRGLAAAMSAGIRCMVVPGELTRGSDFSGAYRVLGSIREILQEL